MPFIITDPCIETKDTACVDVCPVDCIHPRKDEAEFAEATMLYIHPEECIDCGACVPACPVAAIYESIDATPSHQKDLIEANAIYRLGDADAMAKAEEIVKAHVAAQPALMAIPAAERQAATRQPLSSPPGTSTASGRATRRSSHGSTLSARTSFVCRSSRPRPTRFRSPFARWRVTGATGTAAKAILALRCTSARRSPPTLLPSRTPPSTTRPALRL